ncbi:hypothetical protein MJO28_010324 [Puccinia striiformis f. sp. tritici]|uniref:Secreted protein n=3 Tax=Puccinia striiformis TaxID=27350 RepID=A0A0L0W320_9BASI|nr:hypothetical protein Pst134EA_019122 [Puccinia striiformis f. sp. tritici]KAI9613796.1 hypothetical protein H4Q26_009643 [Puccinia striiformis f. sp. tritici PST-130]KNF05670.1 hypothetical protein PSTG_01072 [Puccinia striiformis f. sp. tritici PST-78]KAH9458970.1 hypothetical protein Pst134EA_019122 [Puccinia striiformis f. sp. tritici]KAI7944629.1 hypothetical protein MJO28_010324 [Puccinia striiformis f. sp. tritici]KAI7948404.1 hypothetical protein MJO29_010069 [Puccinia striiformis f.
MVSITQFVIFAAITLLARDSLAIECDTGVIPHRPVHKEECSKAISQIVYNADDTWNKMSKRADYTYGECNISVHNDLGQNLTKSQIEQGFERVLNYCPNASGGHNYRDNEPVTFYFGNREIGTFQAWEPDYPAGLPTCAINDGGARLSQKHCLKAFSDIPTNSQGQLLGDDNQKTDLIQKSYRSCTVILMTSDYSKLVSVKSELEDNLGKTLDFCHESCGLIRIPGGAEGPNGRAYLSYSHGKRGCTNGRIPLLTK